MVIGCGVPQLPEPFGTEYVHRVRDKVVGREFVVGADVALDITHDLGVPLTRTDLVANLTGVADRVIVRKVVVPPDRYVIGVFDFRRRSRVRSGYQRWRDDARGRRRGEDDDRQ